MTPETAELLHHIRRVIEGLRLQGSLMELGLAGGGGFRTNANGRDTTVDSIARTTVQADQLQALVDKHDPEGLTKLA